MTSETPRPKHDPIEVELWTSPPARRWQEVGPVAARVRSSVDLASDVELRLDRRLARAAYDAGADAVVQVSRIGPIGAGTKRAFEAHGLAVRWTEPPPMRTLPGTGASAIDVRDALRGIVHEAPPLTSLVAESTSSLGRAAVERLATIASGSPTRRRVATALSGAIESRAKKLNVSPEARARLEHWAHEAREEIASRPAPPQQASTMKVPSGCALLVLAAGALFVFNVFGTCMRAMTSVGQ